MKKLVIIFLLIVLIPKGALGVEISILGVSTEKIHSIKWKSFLLGAASSAIIHTLSHIVTMEYYDVDYDLKLSLGNSEIFYNATPHEARRICRAGFAGQALVTTALLSFETTRKADFTKGFSVMTFLEVFMYPMLFSDRGDLKTISEHGGDPDRDYLIFSAIAAVNLFRVEW